MLRDSEEREGYGKLSGAGRAPGVHFGVGRHKPECDQRETRRQGYDRRLVHLSYSYVGFSFCSDRCPIRLGSFFLLHWRCTGVFAACRTLLEGVCSPEL